MARRTQVAPADNPGLGRERDPIQEGRSVPEPVFLLASERSGTNLLRRRLTQWQNDVFGPSPSHILKHLGMQVSHYGDLQRDEHFLALIDDALSLCYDHFSPWEIRLDREEVLLGCDAQNGRPRSLIGLAHWLHHAYARSKGFRTYFCKDNDLSEFALQIRQSLPRARFIYLHRDPRDFVLSQIHRLLGSRSITACSRMWRDQQRRCLRVVSDPTLAGACHRLSYEQLIADERESIRAVCEFLGTPMRDEPEPGHFDQGTCREWKNLDRPTMPHNSGKYRTGLSSAAVSAIESICWTEMHRLGYQSESRTRPATSKYFQVVEPTLSKTVELLRRPLAIRRDAPGRAIRAATLRRIRNRRSNG